MTKRNEQALQMKVARYLDMALPSTAAWFHIPNGGYRRKTEAAILKGMGAKAGVPDICIIWDGRAYFIELKSETGRVSDSQVLMMRNLTDAGAGWLCCKSLGDVCDALVGWGIPLKARVAA